ncbi:unnamed protein product, partial [Gongylonema pulchrum]|uniref:ATP-binding protein n=1 Tax=Gongylonema pulchrum TaxID=637853 RepID=A0A183EUY0_9BILA
MDKVFEGRIVPSLKGEVSALRRALTYMLNNFWDETFWLRKMNDKIILQIPTSASAALNEKLSAMDVLNLIDGKISKFASTLMQYFCQPIISATELTGIIDYRSTISLTRRDYIVQKKQSMAEGTKKNSDAKKVFSMILEFFTNMHADLGGITINGKGMVQLIGEKLSNGLVEKLVHECLTPAVPYETEDLPAFEQLLAASEEFSAEMK